MRGLRYAGLALGGVIVLVLVALAIGAALPVEHRAERSAVVAAPPGEVYALISDVSAFPTWRSDVQRTERMPARGDTIEFREYGPDGAILYRVEEAVPGERWVTRIADPGLPFGGRWIFTLRPAGAGTELRIVEEGEVYNPLYRFVSRFVMGHTRGIERYLDDVNRRLGGTP